MPYTTVEEQHRQTLERFVKECVNPGNFATMAQIFAPEHVTHSPTGDLDRAGIVANLLAMRSAFPDFEMTIDHMLVEGDRVATRRSIRGTFTRALHNPNGTIPPNGKPIELHYINIFRFNEAGLVAEEWTIYDHLGFMRQLGVGPAGPGPAH